MLVVLTLYKEKVAPLVVTAPRALGPVSWCKNQTLPSGPAQIPPGAGLLFVLTTNSVMVIWGPCTLLTGALVEPPLEVVPAELGLPDAAPLSLVPPLVVPPLARLVPPVPDVLAGVPPLPEAPPLVVEPPLLAVVPPASLPTLAGAPSDEQAPAPAARARTRVLREDECFKPFTSYANSSGMP
jgi:hypothetical protein